MPKRKKIKELSVFSRNSYKGRLKGVLPAFLPNRCNDLTDGECLLIIDIEASIKYLLAVMNRRD